MRCPGFTAMRTSTTKHSRGVIYFVPPWRAIGEGMYRLYVSYPLHSLGLRPRRSGQYSMYWLLFNLVLWWLRAMIGLAREVCTGRFIGRCPGGCDPR